MDKDYNETENAFQKNSILNHSNNLSIGQMSEAQKAISRFLPNTQMSEAQKALSRNNFPINKMSEAQKAISRFLPNIQMSEAQKALSRNNFPINKMSEAQKAISRLLLNTQMSEAQKAFSRNDFNWVLTKPVIDQMYSTPNKRATIKIFNKIPRDKYDLSQKYIEDNDNLEYVVENKETKESIPVRDIANSIALTDIIDTLTTEDVFSFYNHLVKFPMLGLHHQVGRKIFEEIEKVQLETFEDVYVYRVRSRDKNKKSIPFTELEMFQAPHGMASHGRFNVIGQGELYTCSSEEVAIKEVAIKNKDYRYDIIKWRLVHPVKLLDLTRYDSPLVDYSSVETSSANKQEYLIPNYLSQCLKFHDINGIRYKSVLDNNQYNYVFFDFENKWFEVVDLKVSINHLDEIRRVGIEA